MAQSRKDYYEILGVSRNASDEDIRKAYRKLVKEWHPDAYKGSSKKDAESKFKEIQEAYEVLSDKEKRAMFDRFGYVGDPASFSRGSGRTPGNAGGNFDEVFGDFQDVFDVFFGGSRSGASSRSQGPRAVRGEDIHASVVIELRDVILGKKVVLEYDRNKVCQSCNG
ncbi:MAG: DnaJ domain-containing protein, partial [Kosmotogaceae bacterium]